MIVYEIEKAMGLEEKIKSNASIAYALAAVSIGNTHNISIASLEDPDVYHNYSILVSTSWNKNDDVFLKEEVWAARHTPIGKPTNLNHDEKQIVGNIHNVWPVDKEYKRIAENTNIEELPDYYHLLVSSIIYRQFEDPELKTRAEDLIAKIESGEMFVSMECLFKNFDYAVQDAEGNQFLIPRNESTAFLTSALRAYGGLGEYQGKKIGRALRNLNFSGKGYVLNPANEASIVFNKNTDLVFAGEKKEDFTFSNAASVSKLLDLDTYSDVSNSSNYIITEDINMSDTNKLEAQLSAAQAKIDELQEAVSKANVAGLEKQVSELTNEIKTANNTVATVRAELDQVTQKYNATEAQNQELQKKLAEAANTVSSLEASMKEMEKKQKQEKRMAQLVEAGYSKEEAEAKASIFETLSDDQFVAIVDLAKSAMDSKKKKDMMKDEKAKCSTNTVDTSLVTEAEVDEEPDLSASAEVESDEEFEKTKAEIAQFINARFNIKGDE